VTFSIAAGSAGVCSISGATVSMTSSGTCIVNANQAGNGTYGAAAQVQQSFAVAKGSQTITFTSTPGHYDRNDPPYIVSASATSGLAVTFTTDPSSNGVCSVSGNTVSFQSRGTCIVYANQAGNGGWLPAPQIQQVLDIKNHTPG
jgi:large repetitive protein